MKSAESSGITAIMASVLGRRPDRWDRPTSSEAVELLGRDHGADLGGRRRSGAPGREQRRQNRSELPYQAQADDGAERLGGPKRPAYCNLEAEHHPDRETAHADDDEREDAELVDLVDEEPDAPRRQQRGAYDLEREERERSRSMTKRRTAQRDPAPRGSCVAPRGRDHARAGRSSGAVTAASSRH